MGGVSQTKVIVVKESDVADCSHRAASRRGSCRRNPNQRHGHVDGTASSHFQVSRTRYIDEFTVHKTHKDYISNRGYILISPYQSSHRNVRALSMLLAEK